MKKIYEEPNLTILLLQDEIVMGSSEKDPFDDDYNDPNFQGS